MQNKCFLITLLYICVAWQPTNSERNVVAFYNWPGPLTVPVDKFFAPVGPVQIVLSDDDSSQRQLRIAEKVAVILDCSKVVNRTKQFLIDSNLPLSRLMNITWYAQFYDRKGELTGSEIVVTESISGLIKYDIFGRYNEFLEANGSIIPSAERKGGTANYRCQLCYNSSTTVCNSSTVFVNVIGDPPVVIIGETGDFRNVGRNQYRGVFGEEICISRSMGSEGRNVFIYLTCSHNDSFPVVPIPSSFYWRNGVMLGIVRSRRWVILNTQQLTGRNNTLLIIADFTKDNQFNEVLGNYTCSMRNLFGTSNVTTVITECCEPTDYPNITTGSGFLITPNENTIRIGASTCFSANLKIQCMVDTELDNDTTIEWTKDGMTIQVHNESSLTSILTVDSAGVYTCIAKNRCGTNSATSHVIDLPVIDSGSGPIINETIKVGRNACLAVGASLNLVCQSSSPQVTYSWRNSSNTVLGTSSTLRINKTGTYICTATNPCGRTQAQSVIRKLPDAQLRGTITGRGGCSRLSTAPSNVDLCPFLGDRLSLVCSSNETGVVRTLIPPGSTDSLNIGSVNASNGGIYTCTVTNECGTSRASLNVQVYDPARVDLMKILPSSNASTTIIGAGRNNTANAIITGQRVELHCPYTGIETPLTGWFKLNSTNNLVPINRNGSGILIYQSTNSVVLVIENYNSSFAGQYRCVTSNLAGTDSGSVLLTNAQVNMGEWRTSSWSNCSKSCGGGERTRTVTCVSTRNSMVVNTQLCSGLIMPHNFEYCNTDPCCEKDLHISCKFNKATDSCNKQEYKDACCCTCSQKY